MSKKISSISILLKPTNISDFSSILPNLCMWLLRRKVNVYFLTSELDRLKKTFKTMPKNVSFISTKEEAHNISDLILSLGGDGTLIGISRLSTKKSPPILGINMGKLGFITEYSKTEIYDALEAVIKGDYNTSKINLYNLKILKRGHIVHEGHFLNDAVVNKNEISRMLALTVDCNKELLYNLQGDGLIVSSPIGSTAYSLAAGGPIINPLVNAMVLSPICPHSLSHRPIVIPNDFTIEIKAPGSDGKITVTLDGQEAFDIDSSCVILITKSKNRFVNLVKNPDRTYFQTLREKFTLGARS